MRLSLGGGSGLGGGGPGEACLAGLGGVIRLGLPGELLTELLLPPMLNFKYEVNLFFPKFDDSSSLELSGSSFEICMLVDCAGEYVPAGWWL